MCGLLNPTAMQETPTAATTSRVTTVLIQGADAFGNKILMAWAASLVATVSPIGPIVTLTDVAPGLVELAFMSMATGTYAVAMEVAGIAVRGSPLSLAVQASLVPDLSKTIAWGGMLDGAFGRSCRR
jgi:hypothetical protein